MNDLDELIRSALQAKADTVQETRLRPLEIRRHSAVRWVTPVLAAAAVLIVVVTLSAVSGTPHAGTSAPGGPRPTMTEGPSVSRHELYCSLPDEGCPGTVADSQFQPLWPFASYQRARQWETSARPAGHSPWHADAKATALFFVRNYLRFSDITTVTSVRNDAWPYARVGVGYLLNGQKHTTAIIQLVRYSPHRGDTKAGWEVVGTADSSSRLTITRPPTHRPVRSPMTVGGRITGVDENIAVTVRTIGGGVDRIAPVPAGGQNAPWSVTVPFSEHGVLTVVASTGGHVQQHEAFAVVGVVSVVSAGG